MSKTLRTIAVIAGSVALIATGVGAVAGSAGIAGVASASTISAIATYASVAAGVASVGAQITAPKPIARGSPAQITIDIEPPRPYAVGRIMVGGVIRHDVAYGPTLKKVPNPYRWQVRVLSGVGPIQGFVGEFFDFQPISSFYSDGFLSIARQNGNRPEASALSPPIIGTGASHAPGWSASSKLSGCAAVGLNLRFDKDGQRYASGMPIYTALLDGEKVYDPRLDSTFPGGSGPCRAGVESTYVFSQNPACHAITYALGRFQNGIRIFGLGQAVDTLDLPAVVDWANDCDANGWTVNILLQEGGTGANLREQRVRNLDDLCAAGGGRWYQAGGLLSFDWHRPRVSLATLTDDDILLAGGGTDAVPTVRDRMNGVRPQYISPIHNWQQITADEIVGSTYRTEDGEKLTQVYPLNGVTDAEQAGELAAYAMADSREIGPMDIQAKVNWRFYRPGDTITLNSSLVAYQGQAVINQRSLNPQSLAVALSLKSETPGKHDFALGKVATPPPTPILAQTSEERDLIADAAFAPRPEDVAEAVAPANANRVPFSRMEGNRGWPVLFNPSAIPAAIDFGEFAGIRFVRLQCNPTASGQQLSFGQQGPSFRVTPGERLSIQARLENQGGSQGPWQLEIWTFDNDGVTQEPSIIAAGSGARFITDAPVQAFFTVPASKAFARLEFRVASGSAGFVQAAIGEPMVTSAAAGQTVHPPFSPGPNASDGADPNNLITIDGAGNISGIGTANINVDNRRTILTGTIAARPASGAFIGQSYAATDTGEISQWDGFNWIPKADITFAVTGLAELALNYASDLTLTSPLPVTATYQLGAAGTGALTSGVSWAVSVVSGSFAGAAPSISGSSNGLLSINSAMVSAEALLRITATFGGRSYPAFTTKLTRRVAPPSSSGGSGGGGSSASAALTSINSSSFARAHANVLTLTPGSGVTSIGLVATAALHLPAAVPLGSSTVEGKWRYRTSPSGTWIDVGAVATSAPSPVVYNDAEAGMRLSDPGSITCNRTATGLTSGIPYDFEFVARVSAGNVRAVTFDGNASATA